MLKFSSVAAKKQLLSPEQMSYETFGFILNAVYLRRRSQIILSPRANILIPPLILRLQTVEQYTKLDRPIL